MRRRAEEADDLPEAAEGRLDPPATVGARPLDRASALDDTTRARETRPAGDTPRAEPDPPLDPPLDPVPGPGPDLAAGTSPAPRRKRRPLYPRLLRLRHVRPNVWQRFLLGEGALLLAVVLVLADLATAWTLLVLPLAVAAVVKAHDVLAGLLGRPARGPGGHLGAPGTEPDERPGAAAGGPAGRTLGEG